MLRNTLFFLFKILFVFIVTLLLLEIAVRILGYSKQYLYDAIYQPFNKTEGIPYVHKPNLRKALAMGNTVFDTDELGLRTISADGVGVEEKGRKGKKEKEYRVAFVGDSVTFGSGVKTEDTFCHRIQNILNEKEDNLLIRVFNYGVDAYSAKEMTATLKHRMLDINPDIVILSIVYDDFNTSRCGNVDRRGYLANHQSSLFVHKDSVVKYLLRKIHLSYVIRDILWKYRSFRIQRNDGTKVENTIPSSYKYLREFKEIAVEHNIPYLIVTLPSIGCDGSEFRVVREKLSEDGIHFFDVSNIGKDFSDKEFRVSKFDGHPSALVHKKISEMISDYLLSRYLRND